MRVFVTGATGFIGSHLCRSLVASGHELRALSRSGNSCGSSNSAPRTSFLYNIGERMPSSIIDFCPEVIVHLAWDGIPDFSEKKCLENVEMQLRFLKQTEQLPGLKKIIVAGSCREYGASHGAQKESNRPPPDSYFSWAKQTLHDYFTLSSQDRQIKMCWFRIFYVYGPGQRPKSLIPSLIDACIRKEAMKINTPTAANDYIYIDDVVSAFVSAAENEDAHGTYNLGSGALSSVSEIIEQVDDAMLESEISLNRSSADKRLPVPLSGMWADISLAKQKLGWVPQTSLAQGINCTCNAMSL